MSGSAAQVPLPSGLSAEQMGSLRAARYGARKVNRAARVAAFSGWTLATFAVITLISGIFSVPAFILGVGMAIVARIELLGARGLRHLDPGAPRRLGFNQIALAAMLSAYGGWGILNAVIAPGPYDEQIAAGGDVARMLEPIAALHVTIAVAAYAGLIVGALIAGGCASLYYFTRRRHVEMHLARTPEWAVETLRAVA